MADQRIAPGLLIAMPDLLDPNFARTVVLMCAHSAEGAFGLVINRGTDIPVDAVCSEAGIEWHGAEDVMVQAGGPVERQRGWVLHSDEVMHPGSQLVDDGVALAASHEALRAFAGEPEGRYRLVLGYAGWGPGQLEEELDQGSWLTADLDVSLVFDTPTAEVWGRALTLVGIDPTHLVSASTALH